MSEIIEFDEAKIQSGSSYRSVSFNNIEAEIEDEEEETKDEAFRQGRGWWGEDGHTLFLDSKLRNEFGKVMVDFAWNK